MIKIAHQEKAYRAPESGYRGSKLSLVSSLREAHARSEYILKKYR